MASDPHLGHRNIRRYHNRPDDCDERFLANWRERVGWRDSVLLLGDVTLEPHLWLDRLARLPGRVWLVRGDHDRMAWLPEYRRIGWRVVEPFELLYQSRRVLFSHQPVADLPDDAFNVHGHIHTNHDEAPTPRYINACVEVIGYGPVLVTELLATIASA